MKNQIGMVICYSPTGRKIKGQRFGLLARWRLRQRRKHSYDLEGVKGW